MKISLTKHSGNLSRKEYVVGLENEKLSFFNAGFSVI